MFDQETMIKAREEYLALPEEGKNSYLGQLTSVYGQDWVDAFKMFMENGDYPKFADAVKVTAELPSGVVQEPGVSMEEGYARSDDDVAASLSIEHAPVYEVVKAMGDEYHMATPEVKEKMIERMGSARGNEFSEAVKFTFENKDFCEYIARETQSFFDTLSREFSESNDQLGTISNLGNFSEEISNGLLSYSTKGKPTNFSVLEAVALLTGTARRNFSETGALADALATLGEGEVSEEAAETQAENLVAYKNNTSDNLEEKIAKAAENLEDKKDMSDDADETDAVIREKEQNNATLDSVIEKYKALQTPEAKAQMLEAMQQVLDPELVDYIVKRAEGEDFSEDGEKEPEAEVKEEKVEGTVEDSVAVGEEGDVDRYEELSKKLLGQYANEPKALVDAPVAVSTLPEGAPVATAEGGVTMAEDYQRDDIMDQYEKMGLV